MSAIELEQFAKRVDPNYIAVKDLGDGRYAMLSPLLFHYTIKVGAIGDTTGYDDRWCFTTKELGQKALDEWDIATMPEPDYWHRHPHTGRRRINGDKSTEYIAW